MNISDLLMGSTMRAAHITRYGSIPVTQRETVAEHSFYVAFYTAIIAADLEWDDGSSLMAVEGALIHDVDECLTGDFLRSFKYSSKYLLAELKQGADQAALKVFREINCVGWQKLYKEWTKAKTTSKEGSLVKFCDFLSVVAYLAGEAAQGNRYAITMIDTELCDYWDLFKEDRYDFVREYHQQVKHLMDGGWSNVRVTV